MNWLLAVLLAPVLFLAAPQWSSAQEAPAGMTPGPVERVTNPPPPTTPTPPGAVTPSTGGDDPQVYLTYKTPFEFHLTVITAALGVFMALLLSVMGWRTGINEDFVRTFMVVIIVFGALFLVVAGYSDEQTAPVFGLLGTIAGYIFGRTQGAVEATAGGASAANGNGGPPPPPTPVATPPEVAVGDKTP